MMSYRASKGCIPLTEYGLSIPLVPVSLDPKVAYQEEESSHHTHSLLILDFGLRILDFYSFHPILSQNLRNTYHCVGYFRITSSMILK